MAHTARVLQFLPLLIFIHAVRCMIHVQMSEGCLECICLATTDCNMTTGCLGDVCGPYWITKPYWTDGRSPTIPRDQPSRRGAFERCANDPVCAGETIQNYMKRFKQDCNKDGMINCLDYAKIHRLGGYGCYGRLDPKFKAKFDPCLKEIGESQRLVDITQSNQEIEIFK